MDLGLLSALSIGFILGIKHAIEPDHVIAVSTIASHSRKLWRATLTGMFWGIGHTLTLLIVGLVLILMKGEISEVWALSLEFSVGIMLVYLGLTTFFSFRKKKRHVHKHEHGGNVHKHFHSHEYSKTHNHDHRGVSWIRSVFIGSVHGLAGSAAIVLLTMSTITSFWKAIVYILIFGAGTVIGMLLFTTILGIPFVFTTNQKRINHTLIQITGVISILFGFYYMYNLGITGGLFKLWIQ